MADDLAPGTLLIGRYRIVHLVGTGGMGTVYKAADTQLGDRIVALKALSQSGLNPQELAEATEAFKREALLLASLHHPGLPGIHDHFTTAGHWYLVMDFIEGETLEDYFQHAGRPGLPVAEVLRIADQLCAVLDYLHQHAPPVIFRDLKPSNVMVTGTGQPPGQLRLIDFGIARFFKPGQARDTVSLGSPGYAAPEQYGQSQTTVRSDIFSFGALLHHLLTGVDPSLKPFAFLPIQPYNPQTPPALEALILRMVQLDESRRPPSVAVVRQELDQIARHMNMVRPAAPPQHAPSPLLVQLPPIYQPPPVQWTPQPVPQLSPPGSRRRARGSVSTLVIIGTALAVVCVVAAVCCASSLVQNIAAIQSASGTPTEQQAETPATPTTQAAFAPLTTPTESPTSTPTVTPTEPPTSTPAPTSTPDLSPYSAPIPGPGCDSGSGVWQSAHGTPTPSCTGAGMVLTVPPSATTLSEVFFTWPGHPFTSNYSVRVIVSDFQASNTCAGVVARASQLMGYGIYACANSTWWIYQYDAAGTPHLIQNGNLPSSGTYLVGFTVTGSMLQIVVGGQTIPIIPIDANYTDTAAIPLATYSSASGGSAMFSDFVYAASL